MTRRLDAATALPDDVLTPAYDRTALGEGIVHIGLGSFHKAHQAVYTDDALAAGGGDWRIVGVSLRSNDAVRELRPQDNLYTLLQTSVDGTSARVIGALSRALAHAHGDAAAVRATLADPATRIVTITVTEKGYGVDRGSGGADPDHPAIAHDLGSPDGAVGVAGLIVQALKARRAAGIPPFTVLSCDNLPGNGDLVRGLFLDFARRTAPELADWIAGTVAFPSSMVDRITPAPDDATRAAAREMLGCEDMAAVRAERFRQWVIEDRFPSGRPGWEAGGALFVNDVAPYERMKLRMLNGAHSMMAHAGVVAGDRYVRDVMERGPLKALVRRHLNAAAATLDPLGGVDFADYARDLVVRFENPGLAHGTYQIAMDGTEKLPQRIFDPAVDTIAAGGDPAPFAFATAAWMRYTLGRTDAAEPYELRDPRQDEIAARLKGAETVDAVASTLFALPDLAPARLRDDAAFRGAVTDRLARMLKDGMAAAAAHETA